MSVKCLQLPYNAHAALTFGNSSTLLENKIKKGRGSKMLPLITCVVHNAKT